MAEGILLNLYAPIYYENTWNMSSEQAADVAGVFPFWSDEVYEPLIPPGDIGQWYDPTTELQEKRVKLIGAVAGECFAAEIDSGPYEPEDIRYDDQKVLDYKDGIYATQTFGHFIGVFSGDAFFGEVTSGPTDINEINHLQPDPQDYKDGIYATQTFGKFVGVFSDDVFSGEVASGVEPIDYTQQPETPYPDYKDPDWVVEEEEVVVTDELFIGLRTNEAYVADDVSAPIDVESINKNQPEPQKYKDGIYSTQTFGTLCHAISGEADAWSGIASGCKTADEEQVEQDYKDGIYSTQTFGKFVGVFSDDVFSFEVASGVEPIPQGQKPETPYPNYKDPDWVVEEEVIILLDEEFIGARSPEIYAGDDKSAPLKVEDINPNQKDEEPFIKGIYSTQTFGQYIGVASGDAFSAEVTSGVLEYHQINNNQAEPQDYKDGIYSTQTFGKYVGTFSNDIFFGESVSGVEPIPQGQKPETPYPNYKDPDWVVEEEYVEVTDELRIGARTDELYAADDVSAAISLDTINKNQPDPQVYKDGIYSIQTFGELSFAYSGEDMVIPVTSGDSTNENQIEQKYKNGVYSTQTFGKFEVYSNDDFALISTTSENSVIDYNQKSEIPYPNYRDPEWIVEKEEEIITDELRIGARSYKLISGEDISAPINMNEINKNQKLKEFNAIINPSVQTFGFMVDFMSGETFSLI